MYACQSITFMQLACKYSHGKSDLHDMYNYRYESAYFARKR